MESPKRTLVVDNNIMKPFGLCGDFRRYLDGEVHVRRAPQEDLPPDPGKFTHIIFSGSKTSCLESAPWVTKLMDFIKRAADAGTPMLGVCYGHQIIARTFGGEAMVRRAVLPEFGWVEVRQTAPNALMQGLPERFNTFQSHFEEVGRLPAGFRVCATNDRCATQAYFHEHLPIFGVQFHPERNAEEGQRSLDTRRGKLPGDCIFNNGRAQSFFTEDVANTIFRNFLSTGSKR